MTFHAMDWWIIGIFLTGLVAVAIYTNMYSKSVADFLVANRCGGRFLLTTASAMSFLGAATIIAQFQVHYDAGFTAIWWNQLLIPIFLFVSLSGWVGYRWRQTRILTQSQFFELRYSKGYRISAGIIGFMSGVFGLGIIPAVGARFFIGFFNLPPTFECLGYTLATFDFLMITLIVVTLFFTFMGGQVTVMVTDFLQGIVCLFVFLAIFVFLMFKFPWSQIMEGVSYAAADRSLVHPFKIQGLDTYNVTYFLWIAIGSLFLWPVHSMQGPTTCSAKNAHESHMAMILANVRHMTVWGALALMPICAFVVMYHPAFKSVADQVKSVLDANIDTFGRQGMREMTVPVALSFILPAGLLGGFAATFLASFIAPTASYFLIFGGMLIQDVILPFRKTPFNPKTHLWLLRLSILALGSSMYFVGKYFLLALDIQMFWALLISLQAGTIMVPMLGGLYWNRCTTRAAWVSMIVGLVVPIIGYILITQTENFPLNGAQFAIGAVALNWVIFALVSAIDGRNKPFDMDRLLNRGKYAIEEDKFEEQKGDFWLYRLLKIDKDFTPKDKIIYFGVMSLSVVSFIIFAIGMVWNWLAETGDQGWGLYWQIQMWITVILGTLITIWLTIGGFKDLSNLISDLKKSKHNVNDDGRVVGRHNAGESVQ